MESGIKYVDDNIESYIEELKRLVKIPSVSFDGYDKAHLDKSAEATAEMFRSHGLENVELLSYGDAPPYIYGDFIRDPKKPTVLLYAHHDVQPPMRDSHWDSPAFEPTIRDGRMFGRGTADDKAGIVIHSAAVDAWLKTVKELPLNIKIIIEGEEEVGSHNLSAFVGQYKDKLQADVLVVNDCANFETGFPSLTTSLRGMLAFNVTVSAMKAPLHSGLWSGPIPDPVMGLVKTLATLTNEKGEIAVAGAMESIDELTDEELADFNALPLTEEQFRSDAGLLPGVELVGGDYSIVQRTWRRPTLTITSIESGAGGIGGNVVMDNAKARISVRVVPSMDPLKVRDAIQTEIKKNLPWGLQLEIENEPYNAAWATDTTHPYFAAARAAMKQGYGRESAFIGCGASIPFVEPLSESLGNIPVLLVGIEDPYTLAHSENESMHLGDFQMAIRAEVALFEELAKVGKV